MSLRVWLDHQLSTGCYPLVLVSVLLCFVHDDAYWIIVIVGLIYWTMRHLWLMIPLWLMVAFWFKPLSLKNIDTHYVDEPVKVVSIHASSVLVESDQGKFYLVSADRYPIGTRLLVSGELSRSDPISSFYGFDSLAYNQSHDIIGSLFDGYITYVDNGMSIQGMVQRSILSIAGPTKGWTLIDLLWFNQESPSIYLVLSSYIYISLIDGFIHLIGYGLTKEKCSCLRISLLVVIGLCFGFSFVVIRQLIRYSLSHTSLDRIDKFTLSVALWLFISNGYVQSVGFMFPFFFSWVNLMQPLSRCKSMLLSIFIQGIALHQINLLSILNFKLLRIVSTLVFLFQLCFMLMDIPLDLTLLNQWDQWVVVYGSPIGVGLIIFIGIYGLIHKYRYGHFILCMIYLIFSLNGWWHPLTMMVSINVGQGDATLIKSSWNQSVILIDTGKASSYDELTNALHGLGIHKIDALFITHQDSDHSDNKDALIQDFNIEQCIETQFDMVDINGIYVTNLNQGGYDNANDNSLVMAVDINGLTILFPGDISASVEQAIFSQYHITIDILKASHHGSNTASSSFLLDTLRPQWILYSAGSPSYYGHPSKAVQQRALHRKLIQFNTYSDGELMIMFTPLGAFGLTSTYQYGFIQPR